MLFSSIVALERHFSTPETKLLGKGSITALSNSYQQWQAHYQLQGGDQFLTIPLHFNAGFSTSRIKSLSTIRVDLYSGEFLADIKGLPTGSYHLWLEGSLKKDETKILAKYLGELINIEGRQYLTAQLNKVDMQSMYLNRFVVSVQSQQPLTSSLLVGSPSLFQKIFYEDQYWVAAQFDLAQVEKDSAKTFVEHLLPKVAYARAGKPSLQDVLGAQIMAGRNLFINETFAGNGRTCSTCHRLDNNHTIDPKYIAKLPNDDPLFIAENNPELAELERSKLLRQFGLVLANIDGFDKPGVLRGVPHLFALGTSMTPEAEFEGTVVQHALGWSADGSPNDGSLRSFTVGAVMQHMPKTLNREEGVDFRMPTDAELDALEAYMLSLGRSSELDLDTMSFSSPIVQKGLELFHSKEPGTGQCKGCHLNAGANSSSSLQNGNRDTGVENMPDSPLKLVWAEVPLDGGFGGDEHNNCGWSKEEPCYGNKEFNMTTVVEAADTGPFFHNNAVNTIEEAVAFYNSNAFHNSPGANPADPNDPESVCERCIHLEPTQITAIALFLRTINAMESIRSSNELAEQAVQLNRQQRRELLALVIAETEDAVEVLEGGNIIPNPESVKLLRRALIFEKRALSSRNKWHSTQLIYKAIQFKSDANNLLLKAES